MTTLLAALAAWGRRALRLFLEAFVPAFLKAFAKAREERAADVETGAAAQRQADQAAEDPIIKEVEERTHDLDARSGDDLARRGDRWRRP